MARIIDFADGFTSSSAPTSGPVIILDTTSSTTKDNGSLVIEGGMGIEENLNVGGDTVLTGNLTVNGVTTTVNTTNMVVTDANIVLNNGGNQSNADSADAGITIGMTDATDAIIHYDSTAASKFKIGNIGSTKEVVTISDSQSLTNKTITSPSITTPSRSDVKQDTDANLITYSTTASNGQLCFATDTKVLYQVIDSALSSVSSSGASSLSCFIKDIKATGVNGGTAAATTFNIRTLNDLSGDTSFVSLSANSFTLNPGTYDIQASAPAYNCDTHQAVIRNTSDSTHDLIGSSMFSSNGRFVQNNSVISGRITIASSKTFQLWHYTQSVQTSSGLGAVGGSPSGLSEVYSQIKITKI